MCSSDLRFDSDTKVGLYARHGIPEVWLVDVRARQLTRHLKPRQGTYASIERVDTDATDEVEALSGSTFDLTGLFLGD